MGRTTSVKQTVDRTDAEPTKLQNRKCIKLEKIPEYVKPLPTSRRNTPIKVLPPESIRMGHTNHWGGYLCHGFDKPPEHCKKPFQYKDDLWWCDFGVCNKCQEKCDQYRRWEKLGTEQYTYFMRRCGVRYV